MSIQKKSLISALKTTKKANVAKDTFKAAPVGGKVASKFAAKLGAKTAAKLGARTAAKLGARTAARVN
jgi:hypothetical protein